MLDGVLDWFKGVFDKLIEFFQWVADFITDLFDNIGDFICKIFVSFYDYVCEHIAVLLDDVANAVPDVTHYITENSQNVAQGIMICNRFFALDVGFSILVGLLTFALVFITIKLVLKLIPTIG